MRSWLLSLAVKDVKTAQLVAMVDGCVMAGATVAQQVANLVDLGARK